MVYFHTPKYQPLSSNTKKRKQGIGVLSTLAHTVGKNKMILFRLSIGETCPWTSVQHGDTETVSTYLNAFVCSAVVGCVCQCKMSAKYGCSVTTALPHSQLSLCWNSLLLRLWKLSHVPSLMSPPGRTLRQQCWDNFVFTDEMNWPNSLICSLSANSLLQYNLEADMPFDISYATLYP